MDEIFYICSNSITGRPPIMAVFSFHRINCPRGGESARPPAVVMDREHLSGFLFVEVNHDSRKGVYNLSR